MTPDRLPIRRRAQATLLAPIAPIALVALVALVVPAARPSAQLAAAGTVAERNAESASGGVAEAARLVSPLVTADEIREGIEVLSSDLLEGREAGERGERRAAGYLVSRLESCEALRPGGEDGGWFQPFEIIRGGTTRKARNVIAVLPGADPALAHEAIVLGAHYDHVGFGRSGNALDGPGEIHNGADDNASGSSTLLDLATSIAESSWRPRHTLVFQWYSGEELGLLGSKHWVEHPTWPLADVTFMLNMDMVGRLTARTLVVGGTGTSPGLAELARGFCDELGLAMIDDPPGTAPSDNTAFYEHDIPAMFLFTGLHPDYHRAGDDPEKINADGARDVGRLALRIAAAIDSRDERPAFQAAPGDAYMFTPTAWLGAAFVAAAPDAPGPVLVAVVLPDGPAERAGLQDGDVVATLDGQPLAGVGALKARFEISGRDEVQPFRFGLWRLAPPHAAVRLADGTELALSEWVPLEVEVRPEIR